jgi:ankyrin repeat protein
MPPKAFVALVVLLLGSALSAPNNMVSMNQTSLERQLLDASFQGDAATVRELIQHGVNVNARTAENRSALTIAALRDHVAVAHLLIEAGANPDIQDTQDNNALLVSGETGSVAMLKEVLPAKPDLTLTNRFGGTALIPACDRGHLEYVREILKTKINVNHVNNLGWTALLEAVILGDGGVRHTEIVRLLLAARADRRIADRDGITALEHAKRRGFKEMVKLLAANR